MTKKTIPYPQKINMFSQCNYSQLEKAEIALNGMDHDEVAPWPITDTDDLYPDLTVSEARKLIQKRRSDLEREKLKARLHIVGTEKENTRPPVKVTVLGRAMDWRSYITKKALGAAALVILSVGVPALAGLWWYKNSAYSPEQVAVQINNLEIDRAQQSLNTLKERADYSSNQSLQAECFYLQGLIDGERARFISALRNLSDSANLAMMIGDQRLLAKANITIMNTYHLTNDNTQALEYSKAAYTIAIKSNNVKHQIGALHVMGLSQFILGKKEAGEATLKRALMLAIEHKQPDAIVLSYNYLGIVNAENKEFSLAKDKIETALATINGVDDEKRRTYLHSITYAYMGRVTALSNEPDKAIGYYRTAIDLSEQAGIQQSLLLSQYRFGMADSLRAAGRDATQVETEIATATALEETAFSKCEISNPFLTAAVVRRPIPIPASDCR